MEGKGRNKEKRKFKVFLNIFKNGTDLKMVTIIVP